MILQQYHFEVEYRAGKVKWMQTPCQEYHKPSSNEEIRQNDVQSSYTEPQAQA